MTLNELVAGTQTRAEPKPLEGFSPQEPAEKPQKADLSLPGVDSYVGSIEGPGEEGYDPVALYKKGARTAIAKAAETLDEVRKERLNEIIRQVGDLSTPVLSTLRRLIQARAETTVPPLGNFVDALGDAVDAAAGTSDPNASLETLVGGLAKAPAGTEDAYLAAAAEVFGAESEALRRAAGGATPAPVQVDPQSGTYAAAAGAVSVDVDFSLFFEVSERTSVRAGTEGGDGGARAYYEATREVSARFSADLSISVSTVGGYLEGADLLSKVDPKLFDDFNEAAAGLARLDDDSLEKFASAAKALFGALDEAAGDTDALDAAGAEVVATARAFVQGVRAAVEGALPGLDVGALFDEAKGPDGRSKVLERLAQAVRGAETQNGTVRALLESLSAAENARSAQTEPPKAEEADEALSLLLGETGGAEEAAPTDEAAA